MRFLNTKTILTACEIWQKFEQELISVHKQSLLEAHRLATTLEDSTQ